MTTEEYLLKRIQELEQENLELKQNNNVAKFLFMDRSNKECSYYVSFKNGQIYIEKEK